MKIEIYHSDADEFFLEGDVDYLTMDIFNQIINNRVININNISYIKEESMLIFVSKLINNKIIYRIIIRKIKHIDIRNRLKRINYVKLKFKIYYNKIIIYPSNFFLRRFFKINLDVDEADIEFIKIEKDSSVSDDI